jgi:hypothetical protein
MKKLVDTIKSLTGKIIRTPALNAIKRKKKFIRDKKNGKK